MECGPQEAIVCRVDEKVTMPLDLEEMEGHNLS